MRRLTPSLLTRSRAPSSRSFSMRKSIIKANRISEQMAAAVRQSNHQSLDDLAKKFSLESGEVPLTSATRTDSQHSAALRMCAPLCSSFVPVNSASQFKCHRASQLLPQGYPACAPRNSSRSSRPCFDRLSAGKVAGAGAKQGTRSRQARQRRRSVRQGGTIFEFDS